MPTELSRLYTSHNVNNTIWTHCQPSEAKIANRHSVFSEQAVPNNPTVQTYIWQSAKLFQLGRGGHSSSARLETADPRRFVSSSYTDVVVTQMMYRNAKTLHTVSFTVTVLQPTLQHFLFH